MNASHQNADSISCNKENHKTGLSEKQHVDCFDHSLFKNGLGDQKLLPSNNFDMVHSKGTSSPMPQTTNQTSPFKAVLQGGLRR